jgi:hypothetical protein
MYDEEPNPTGKIMLGFLLGLALAFACFTVSVITMLTIRIRQDWIFPLLNAIMLAVAGVVALRYYKQSGLARGCVIALALVFALNTICGVTYLH